MGAMVGTALRNNSAEKAASLVNRQAESSSKRGLSGGTSLDSRNGKPETCALQASARVNLRAIAAALTGQNRGDARCRDY